MSADRTSAPGSGGPNEPAQVWLRRRKLAGAAILVVGLLAFVVIQLLPVFDNAERFLASGSLLLAIAGLLFLWLVFVAPLNPRLRLTALVAGVLAALTFVACVKVRGVDGNIVPILSWRWSPPPDVEQADRLPVPKTEARGIVDLMTTRPEDYPQFLGPERRATVTDVRLSRDWSKTPPRQRWRQPIGGGWSAFATRETFAVTQEQRGEFEQAVCYEIATGRARWVHGDAVRFVSAVGGDGPRATPTIAAGRVYTLGATGLLNCLEGTTGEILWQHDLIEEHGVEELMFPKWGKSCSPLVYGDLVIVSAGGPEDQSLVAYHKETGKLVWQAGTALSSYSSPVLAQIGGQPQVLIVNADNVTAHDPTDGKVLWEFPWPGEEPKVPNAVPISENQVYLGAGYGIGSALLEVDRDTKGRWSVTAAWQNRLLKPKFCNVVVRDGYVYGIDDGIPLVCLDLRDGKRQWRGGRYGHGQIILVDDLLLVLTEKGELVLVEATPEAHRELARLPVLEGKTWNNAALSGRFLLVRNDIEAACYEMPLADKGPDEK